MARGTGMIERMLADLSGLSRKESIELFIRWMEKADKALKTGAFIGWMQFENDAKLKMTLFISWMTVERINPRFLQQICTKASALVVTEGFASRDSSKIEGWMEQAFEKDMTLTPSEVARMARKKFRMPQRMLFFLKKLARTIKERIRLRRRKSGNPSEVQNKDAFSVTKKLLAEGTYSMGSPLAETKKGECRKRFDQPGLPGILDENPSLTSTRRIEDYEALVAPYRSLLAGVSSLEVLDELLRLLYEEGDVPSVVGWRGKTADVEYMNLREQKHFLEILQAISLYDHTYNVLKAALDIARDILRGRHDLLFPSVITAAIAHDIGKIASLWRSSAIRRRNHEAVSAAKLEDMLASHGNDPFKKGVAGAIRRHHSGADNEDTVSRIIMDADARAREYEITSADPAFTVKPMAEWLDLTRFAEIILPSINELGYKNRRLVWKAMSFDGIIYCIPEYVRSVLKALAFEKKMLDYRLVRQSFKSDNRAVLNEVSGLLSKNGFLAYEIKKGNFGLRFLFQSNIAGVTSQSLYAIPIKAELFSIESSEIEKRKIDYLKTIVSVRPTGLHF
ncbi:HD domain-containing protein [Syntrophorhabdus aromaticivorans]|uniref:HD domain-containing protein n=1 Tax=Syntrophorhabdus aromaticivorans TaxID=328301 RepID=UPI0004201A01|nr:HD domain-containing protein [Syntrophorhabdus aromaticivorans]